MWKSQVEDKQNGKERKTKMSRRNTTKKEENK